MSRTQHHPHIFEWMMAKIRNGSQEMQFLGIGSYGPAAGPEHRIIARAARRIKAKVFEPLPLTEERMAAIRRLGYG